MSFSFFFVVIAIEQYVSVPKESENIRHGNIETPTTRTTKEQKS